MADSMKDVELGSTGTDSSVEATNNPLTTNNNNNTPTAPSTNGSGNKDDDGAAPTYRRGESQIERS
jgi:hypothetical protein